MHQQPIAVQEQAPLSQIIYLDCIISSEFDVIGRQIGLKSTWLSIKLSVQIYENQYSIRHLLTKGISSVVHAQPYRWRVSIRKKECEQKHRPICCTALYTTLCREPLAKHTIRQMSLHANPNNEVIS